MSTPKTPEKTVADGARAEKVDSSKDLQDMATDVTSTLFGGKKKAVAPSEEKKPTEEKEKPSDATEDAEKAKIEKTAEELKKGEEVKSKPESRRRVEKPKQDNEDVIRRTAAATAEEVENRLKPKDKPAEKKEDTEEVDADGLTVEDSEDYQILKKVEEINRDSKGVSDRFLKFAKSRYEYQAKWEKEHPGETFDPNAEDHEEFFEKNGKEFEAEKLQSLMRRAEVRMEAEKVLEENLRPERERQRVAEVVKRAAPIIGKQVHDRVQSLVRQLDPELLQKLTDEKTGRLILNPDHIKKIEEENPVAIQVLEEVVAGKKDGRGNVLPETSLQQLLIAVEQTAFSPQTGFRLDPKNPVHAKVLGYADDYEKAMEGAPAEVRFQSFTDPDTKEKVVKQFIPVQEFSKLQDEIMKGKGRESAKLEKLKDLDKKYWTVGADEIEDLIIDDALSTSKREIARLNGLIDKKTGKVSPVTFSQPPPEKKPETAAKPRPPALHNQAGVVSATAPKAGVDENISESATKKLFSV